MSNAHNARPDVRSYVAHGGKTQTRVQYKVSDKPSRLKGLILDYAGILDQSNESQKKWRELMRRLVAGGVHVCVVYHDVMGTFDWFSPLSDLRETGCANSIIKVECDAFGSSMTNEQIDDAASSLELDASECLVLSTDAGSVFNALDMRAMIHLVDSLESAMFFTEAAFEHVLESKDAEHERNAA